MSDGVCGMAEAARAHTASRRAQLTRKDSTAVRLSLYCSSVGFAHLWSRKFYNLMSRVCTTVMNAKGKGG